MITSTKSKTELDSLIDDGNTQLDQYSDELPISDFLETNIFSIFHSESEVEIYSKLRDILRHDKDRSDILQEYSDKIINMNILSN